MLFVVVKEVSIQYAVVIGIVRCWASLESMHDFVEMLGRKKKAPR